MNFSVMSRELFLLVIPFVEVVEYGFAPRRAEEVLVVLFVDRTVERVPLFAALAYRIEAFCLSKFVCVVFADSLGCFPGWERIGFRNCRFRIPR